MSGLTKSLIAAVMVAATCGGAAQAGTVLDYAPTFPDVYVGNIAINYQINQGVSGRAILTAKVAVGATGTYKPSSSVVSWTTIAAPTSPSILYDLSVAINMATGKFIPGDLANHLFIKNDSTNYVSSTSLTDFVLQGNDIFGFGFIPSSGTLAPSTKKIVVQLNDPSGITQGGNTITNVASLSFTSTFTGNSAGYADNFAVAVPLPAGVWMGLAGLAMVGGMKMITRRKEALAQV